MKPLSMRASLLASCALAFSLCLQSCVVHDGQFEHQSGARIDAPVLDRLKGAGATRSDVKRHFGEPSEIRSSGLEQSTFVYQVVRRRTSTESLGGVKISSHSQAITETWLLEFSGDGFTAYDVTSVIP